MTVHKPYDAKSIEKQWQDKWHKENVYQTSENSDKKKLLCLRNVSLPIR